MINQKAYSDYILSRKYNVNIKLSMNLNSKNNFIDRKSILIKENDNINIKQPPILIKKLQKINLESKYAVAFDWILSILTLLYGLYYDDKIIIGVGVLAIILAYIRPVKIIEKFLRNKFVKKN